MPHEFLRDLPRGAEVWKSGKTWYAVYTVPGTDVPLLYAFPRPELLRHAFGDHEPHADRELTQQELQQTGAINFGITTELDPSLTEHPWDKFLSDVERDSDIQPWLKDPEVLAHVASAWLRGVSPNMEQTEWWRSKTDEERRWIERAAANPTQARQEQHDQRQIVRDMLRSFGAPTVPDEVADFIADEWTQGRWSAVYAETQARKLADPHAPGEIDQNLRRVMSRRGMDTDEQVVQSGPDAIRQAVADVRQSVGLPAEPVSDQEWVRRILAGTHTLADARFALDQRAAAEGGTPGGFQTTREHEDTVRRLLGRWLGPFHGSWSDDEIQHWAGRLRNDPNALIELEDKLRRLRKTAFPQFTDPDVTYEDIAGIARGMFQNLWGQTPDEHDPLFLKVANMTDHHEASSLLRREGMEREIEPVVNEATRGLLRETGGQIRPAQR